MCRVPDPEDAKYKDDEDAYEDDLEEMLTKTDKIKPKTFPYTLYLIQINPRRTLSLRTCTSLSIPALNRLIYTQ